MTDKTDKIEQATAPATGSAPAADSSPEPAPGGTEPAPAADHTPDADTGGSGPRSAAREAAKYRTRLREAEAQRDALRAQVDAMQKAEVERAAAARLADGTDLWLAGVELADLRDEGGALDAGLVDQAITAAVAAKPHWQDRRRAEKLARAQAGHVGASGARSPGAGPASTWQSAFAPAARD